MRILFIYSLLDYLNPVKPLHNQQQIQFGVSYISSVLKSKGYITDIFVLTRKTKKQILYNFIKKFNPDIIGFTAVSTEYKFISKIARYIRTSFPLIYLLIGGPHVSLNPNEPINDVFDAVCIGEGEYPTLELVEQLKIGKKPTNIKNLWIKNENKIEKNPSRDFIQDLDKLPFPDRKIWQKWIKWTNTSHSILLGRGCPYNCTYCCNHGLRKLASGKYVRFRSVKNILKELEHLIKKFPSTKEIYFEVETIGADLNFGINLCSELERFNNHLKRKLSFGVNLRIVPKIDFEPLFQSLKKANFRFINIGIESGSERIRAKILKRFYSNDDIIKNIKLAKKFGLKVSTYNMIGFPEEDMVEFQKTIEINRKCLPDWTQTSIFFPYPGTELYNLCNEKGLLDNNIDERLERHRAVLNLKNFTKRQVQHQFEWFYYNVYRGNIPMTLILPRIFIEKLNTIPIFNRLYRKITNNQVLRRVRLFFDNSILY